MSCRDKTQIFWDKENIVSVSYITFFGYLVCNSLRILKPYDIVSLTLKTSTNTAGVRSLMYLIFNG